MRDWIGFNKDVGTDSMAKVGQWNVSVAIRALAEAVEEYVHLFKKNAEELPPINDRTTYELVLKGGMRVEGEIRGLGPTWLELTDKEGLSVIVQVSEVACFCEKSSA